jgi:hypothetical protein
MNTVESLPVYMSGAYSDCATGFVHRKGSPEIYGNLMLERDDNPLETNTHV